MDNILYQIEGGIPIFGKIKCMGAKNLATKVMIASLLSNESTLLHNVPNIGDVEITVHLLTSLGVKIDWDKKNHTMALDSKNINNHQACIPDSRSNRVPILLLSVLLAKLGKAVVPVVGGDSIGERNLDFHINAIKTFGATIKKDHDKYTASIDKKLKSSHISLDYPSVGATETCLFLSVLAEGTSVIKNIALEPEIIELINMLNSMGALIFLSGYREITVHGVNKLSGTKFFISGDRIEAASWACLACASNGEIELSGIRPNLLNNFFSYYSKIGGGFEFLSENSIKFFRKSPLKPIIIETDVYPGFSTDWQQAFGILLTQANGISSFHETVHEERFGYLKILNQLGAKTEVVTSCLGSKKCRYKGRDYKHSAMIYGPTKLSALSSPIKIPDLRAGLAYLIAGVLSEKSTILSSAEQIERGYGNLQEKLKDTNLKIQRLIK